MLIGSPVSLGDRYEASTLSRQLSPFPELLCGLLGFHTGIAVKASFPEELRQLCSVSKMSQLSYVFFPLAVFFFFPSQI